MNIKNPKLKLFRLVFFFLLRVSPKQTFFKRKYSTYLSHIIVMLFNTSVNGKVQVI